MGLYKLPHTILVNKFNQLLKSIWCIALSFTILFSSNLLAQNATATLSQPSFQIGDQVNLDLKVTLAPNQSIGKWFQYDTTGSHTEIIKALPIDTTVSGDNKLLTQRLVITSFDSGRWKLPIINPQIIESGRNVNFATDSLFINVLPVDVSQLKDYHDIHDIESVKYVDLSYVYIGLAILLFIIVLVLLIRFFRKKKRPKTSAKNHSPINLAWALSALDTLKSGNVDAYTYGTKCDDIIRSYLDAVGGVYSKWKTSDELIIQLQQIFGENADKIPFFQALRCNDAIKFAKYQPDVQIRNETLEHVKNGLVQLDKIWKEEHRK